MQQPENIIYSKNIMGGNVKAPKRFKKPYRKRAKLSFPMKEAVRKIVNVEQKKNIEFKKATAGVAQTEVNNAAPIITDLTSILSQAVGDDNRLAGQVTLHHLRMKVMMRNTQTATSNEFNLIRCLIFQYNTPTPATAPDPTKIFYTSSISGGSIGASSFLINDYHRIFNVLYDSCDLLTFATPTATSLGQPNSWKYKEFNVPLKYCQKKINYIQDGTTSTNGIWVCFMGNSADPGNSATIAYDYELIYADA